MIVDYVWMNSALIVLLYQSYYNNEGDKKNCG